MKILMLTWEYPPFIIGGLGMACYGLFKALSELGLIIYMILPTKEKVFFEIDSPFSADYPAAKTWDKKQLTPLPLKFYHFHYLEPEGGYLTIKEGLVRENISYPKREPQFLPTPQEVLKRIDFILSQENSLLAKVRLYTQNVLEITKNLDFNLIHAHDWLTYPAGLFLKNIKRVPLVTHIHATEFDRALGYGHPLIHEIEYLGLNYAEKVIAVSNYTAEIIKEHYFIPEEKITVIHNAFTAFTEKPFKVKKFKEPVVLFLGRLTPQKGPKIFLEIAKKVLEREGRVRFLIAGTGEMERELMLEAASLGIGTHILFTGFLTRKEVEAALSMSDIVVMPSVSEPFGIVALEAMYFGCALIVSKQSGVSEVIESAYKVDFWDVDKMVEIIIDLLQNPDKIEKLQAESKEEVKKFSWKERAERVLQIYQEFLS
ncbi:MAG: glycosyltransferase family 4 protein [Thermodesulfobacteriaceae bacterium]|nr:glycosyltransferase family 4 protein [Thermodesulfobacteriaceae bacterium]MCX8041688.1 glycosyltransferase family 4 protein [Thermodesulfobacteriaceae bacterium]MDW8135918.1 glycosyltransferase family 4 protein [Thermodesulfobacterium sp.]